MSLSGHPIPRPDRERPGTMDHKVETSAQRVRHHFRRPLAGSRNLLMNPPETPFPLQTRGLVMRGTVRTGFVLARRHYPGRDEFGLADIPKSLLRRVGPEIGTSGCSTSGDSV